jgi:predicted RNA-binding protein with TRAM domain
LESESGRQGGPRRFGGPRPFRLSPVKVGEEYTVKIESMSRRGDSGVAKIQGLVVFVTNSKVGDDVRVRISKIGRGYATADVVGPATEKAIEAMEPEAEAETSGDSDE